MSSTRVTARFRAIEGRVHKPLSESHFIYLVSVGNLDHEGAYFEATVNLLEQTGAKITFLVAGDLQRHNFWKFDGYTATNIPSDEDLAKQAHAREEKWIKEQFPIYSRLDYEIKVWDEFLKLPRYKDIKSKVDEAYKSNPDYQKATHKTQEIHLKSNRKNIKANEHYEIAAKSGIEYLCEEAPMMDLMLSDEYEYDGIIYPGDISEMLKATHVLLGGDPKTLPPWLPIRHKTCKTLEMPPERLVGQSSIIEKKHEVKKPSLSHERKSESSIEDCNAPENKPAIKTSLTKDKSDRFDLYENKSKLSKGPTLFASSQQRSELHSRQVEEGIEAGTSPLAEIAFNDVTAIMQSLQGLPQTTRSGYEEKLNLLVEQLEQLKMMTLEQSKSHGYAAQGGSGIATPPSSPRDREPFGSVQLKVH